MKILIIGPSWVGDTVMAQALFKLLKTQHQHVQIHVLAPAWTFSLLHCMPEVEKVIEFPVQHGELKLAFRYSLAKKLIVESYDQAIILPNSFKSALIPWFAKIPVRTGWLREGRGLIVNDGRRLDKNRYKLMVEQYLALGLRRGETGPLPAIVPMLSVAQSKVESALQKFNIQLTDQPILGLAAGAEFGPSKRWPEKHYAELAQSKLKQGWQVWLFGSPKDKDVSKMIMEETKGECIDFTGKTDLSETIALMTCIGGMVSNDSGLMHVAAALNKSLVAIYGSTSPDFTPPLSKKAKVLQLTLPCQPCFKRTCPLNHHRCMQDLKPQIVLNAMQNWN